MTAFFRSLFIALIVVASLLVVPAHAAMGKITSPLGFGFDLPRGWEGYQTVEDGSGYVIVTGIGQPSDVDIALFANFFPPPEMDEGRTEPFTFADGMWGRKLRSGSALLYSRLLNGRQVTLVITAPPRWLKTHHKALETMGRSLRGTLRSQPLG